MYYIYVSVRVIPTYRVYRLYDYTIVKVQSIRVAFSLAACHLVCRLKEKRTDRPILLQIVLCFVVHSNFLLHSSSFEWLTFPDCANLSWKEKATYVDGVYSEGTGLQLSSELLGWINSRTQGRTLVVSSLPVTPVGSQIHDHNMI